MARKAIVTFAMVESAYEEFCKALALAGFKGKVMLEVVNESVTLGSGEKGFKGLRATGDVPKGFGPEFSSREDAYNTMKTWVGVLQLVREFSPESDAVSVAEDLHTNYPESVAEATKPVPPQRRRKVSESAK